MKRTALFIGLIISGLGMLTLSAQACFGPKLYIGIEANAGEEVLYELVALYLKEKTGVQTERVDLEGRDPLVELTAERIDLALAPQGEGPFPALLSLPGFKALRSGARPLNDLQFTTVPRALQKLSGLLTVEELRELITEVEAGAAVKARVRHLLMERGWI